MQRIIHAMQIDLGGIAALIVAAFTLWKVLRMTSKEARQVDADAADKYATASTKTAELNERLQVKVETLTAKIETHECKIGVMDADIKNLQTKLTRRDNLLKEWQKGIGVLIDQLIAAGKTPDWRPDTTVEDLDKDL